MQLSRRAVLTSSAAGVAVAGVALGARADASAPQTHALPVSRDPVLHALRRTTFGVTPDLVAQVRRTGFSAWVDEQLSGGTDVGATVHGTGLSTLPVSLSPVLQQLVDDETQHRGITDLQVATFARAAYGDQQLHEVLVEVFTNHLSIYGPGFPTHKVVDDRKVVRKHVLGSFADMLAASARSPAMLLYLDQAHSVGHNPNENYARELLELHSVGAKGGYTQRDVHDAALALTGLSVDPSTGDFLYRPEWHATGRVRVMGWTHPNADREQGLDVALSLVSYLAHHPMTAKRIAAKLVRRFVADTPPADLVASAAAVYRAHGTQIVPVVKHVLGSAAFRSSVGAKSQRPFEWFVAAVRALQLQPEPTLALDGASVLHQLRALGQAPFEWSPPNGYPDVVGAYASTATMLARWNAAQALVNGRVPGLKPMDAAKLLGTPVPTTAGGVVDRLSAVVLGAPPRAGLKRAVLTGVGVAAAHAVSADQARALAAPMAALVLSSPEALVR